MSAALTLDISSTLIVRGQSENCKTMSGYRNSEFMNGLSEESRVVQSKKLNCCQANWPTCENMGNSLVVNWSLSDRSSAQRKHRQRSRNIT